MLAEGRREIRGREIRRREIRRREIGGREIRGREIRGREIRGREIRGRGGYGDNGFGPEQRSQRSQRITADDSLTGSVGRRPRRGRRLIGDAIGSCKRPLASEPLATPDCVTDQTARSAVRRPVWRLVPRSDPFTSLAPLLRAKSVVSIASPSLFLSLSLSVSLALSLSLSPLSISLKPRVRHH
jgi:hypothetical protein